MPLAPYPGLYVRLMERLYWACIVVAAVSIVCMTVLIFTGVVMRYGFSTGARFAEPMSIFFAVQLTMYGAAACYRANVHLRLQVFTAMMPESAQKALAAVVHVLLVILALAMIWYGVSLARTTWFQSYPEFQHIRVGVVYTAIPGSGVVFLLFLVEKLIYGERRTEEEDEEMRKALAHAEEEARRLAGGG